MVVWLETETWEIGKGGLKGRAEGSVVGRRVFGAAGFCGLCVSLSVFLLL
jgi:hypothetical protein